MIIVENAQSDLGSNPPAFSESSLRTFKPGSQHNAGAFVVPVVSGNTRL